MSAATQPCQYIGGPMDGQLREQPSVTQRLLAGPPYYCIKRGHRYDFDAATDTWVDTGAEQ